MSVGRRRISLSKISARQCVGIRETDDQTRLVRFLHYDLGFFDRDTDRVEPTTNPFMPEIVLTMSPE